MVKNGQDNVEVIFTLPPDPLHCNLLGPMNDAVSKLESYYPCEMENFFKNLSLKRSRQGPGSQFNGPTLKTILQEDSLKMLYSILPVNGYALISYFRSLKEVHRICLAQEIDPEYRKIITDFENIFNLMYDTSQLNMTLKIHFVIHHYTDYIEQMESSVKQYIVHVTQ